MTLIKEMGSDISINTFAVNFKINNNINTNVIEANNLNKRIFQRLSITDDQTKPSTRPIILNSTQLPQSSYGACLDNYKRRLGLEGKQDLYTLINAISSPFPTLHNFTSELAGEMEKVIDEEIRISQYCSVETPDIHGFVMQGTSTIHLVHISMLNMESHRHQLIITGELPADIMEKYVALRKANPGHFFTLANAYKDTLGNMIEKGEFEAVIDIGIPKDPK